MRRDIGELSKDFGVQFDRPLFGRMEAPYFCILVTALVLDGSIVGFDLDFFSLAKHKAGLELLRDTAYFMTSYGEIEVKLIFTYLGEGRSESCFLIFVLSSLFLFN